jgi:uncharacterized protein YqgC (DUF456 family)
MNLAILWWIVVGLLVFIGLLGTLLPLVPGTACILAGAMLYQWLIAPTDNPLSAWTIGGMASLTILSYLVDLGASMWGAQRFGASKWGLWGGFLGILVGIFGGLPGLIFGPPAGVIAGELWAGKPLPAAFRTAWGTIVGNAAGILARFGIGVAMVVWFAVAICR